MSSLSSNVDDDDLSDIETHITGSFDLLPPPTVPLGKKTRRDLHSRQTQRKQSDRSRSTPYHRSASTDSSSYRKPSSRSRTAPHTIDRDTMGKKYQTGLIHRSGRSSTQPQTTYHTSVYIDEAHTHRRSQEALRQNSRTHYEHLQKSRPDKSHLYLDPQTGMI